MNLKVGRKYREARFLTNNSKTINWKTKYRDMKEIEVMYTFTA